MKKRIIIIAVTTALTTLAIVSVSAKIIESKGEKPAKNQVCYASPEKINAVIEFSKVYKQAALDAVAAEEARVAKEKADALVAEKAKQNVLDTQAGDKLALDKKKAADAKKVEDARVAKIAADKAKQEESERIIANQKYAAQIAAQQAIEKKKSDDAAAKLKTEKIEEYKKDKIEADRLLKIQVDKIDEKVKDGLPVTDEDKQAKAAAEKFVKEAADRLAAAEAGSFQTVIGAKLAAYLSSADNIVSVLNKAIDLHGGVLTNNCVFFSSVAMSRIDVVITLGDSMCNTGQYLAWLSSKGWVSSYDIKKLTPGSLCFTTNDNWSGHPTHTFTFISWVNSGNYTLANVADNQDNKVHVRNMGATKETEAFAFFMHN